MISLAQKHKPYDGLLSKAERVAMPVLITAISDRYDAKPFGAARNTTSGKLSKAGAMMYRRPIQMWPVISAVRV